MKLSINEVWIGGNLTRDPEMKYLPSGSAVANTGIAINEEWVDKKTKEKREECHFIEVFAYGKTAELLGEHFRKGGPLLAKGKLVQERWESKDGKKQSKTKVKIERIHFVGGSRDQHSKAEKDVPTVVPDTDSDDRPF